ncbi:HNH endonuclease [Paenibacillus alvei]|nr:HNH endonuclease [Paenibacillus alvei]MCY9577964.1 HNH endonuclease [Paenibacillus alvei]
MRNAVGESGRRKFVKLHRVLTDAPDGKVVDHVNGNTLDNRKSNLRVTDEFKNAQNVQKPSRNNKSGELNVYWNNHDQCWVASVMRYGKTTRAKRKRYEEAVEAARQMRNGTYIPRRVGVRRRCS